MKIEINRVKLSVYRIIFAYYEADNWKYYRITYFARRLFHI